MLYYAWWRRPAENGRCLSLLLKNKGGWGLKYVNWHLNCTQFQLEYFIWNISTSFVYWKMNLKFLIASKICTILLNSQRFLFPADLYLILLFLHNLHKWSSECLLYLQIHTRNDWKLFLTASRASLAVLGIAFRRQHFWKTCCISELFWNMLFKLDQTSSNLIKLDWIGLNWFKLDQTWSNLMKLDPNGLNWFKLAQTCSNLIKME